MNGGEPADPMSNNGAARTPSSKGNVTTVRLPSPGAILAQARCILKQQISKNPSDYPSYPALKAQLVEEFEMAMFDANKLDIQKLFMKTYSDLQKRAKHIGVVLLFDVDETLAISENSLKPYEYNEPLIKVWRKTLDCLKKSVTFCSFLFTSQVLCTPAFVYQPADEPSSEPSRVKLRIHLRNKHKIKVPAVITSFDPFYDPDFRKKIGSYYRDNIEPFERRIQSGKRIAFDDAELAKKKILEKELSSKRHKERMAEMEKQTKTTGKKKISIFDSAAGATEVKFGPKQAMMRYLMGYLVKDGFITPDRCTKIMLCDDRKDVLSAVEKVCSQKSFPSVRFMGMLAKKDEDEAFYAKQIFAFLRREFQSYPRLCQVARQMKVVLNKSYGPMWRRRHECFSAQNAVDFFLEGGYAICIEAAVGFGQALLEHDMILPVEEEVKMDAVFGCNKTLYRVAEQVEAVSNYSQTL